jgi:hypothetical protein
MLHALFIQSYEFKHGKKLLKRPKTTKLNHAAEGASGSCEPGTTFTYKVRADQHHLIRRKAF